VCVNQGDGTIKVYDKDNVEIGSSSTDIGTITYTGINFALGNRGEQVSTFNLNGYIVMAAVFNSALDEVQRANVLESLSPQIQKSLNVPATALSAFNTEFASYKVGAFVSYGMTTYTNSDAYSVNKDITPPVVGTFDPPSGILATAAGWINDIEATGKVDFYCLTSGHHIGFK